MESTNLLRRGAPPENLWIIVGAVVIAIVLIILTSIACKMVYPWMKTVGVIRTMVKRRTERSGSSEIQAQVSTVKDKVYRQMETARLGQAHNHSVD